MLRLDRWYQNRLLSGTDLPKLKKGTDEYRALQRIAATPWAKLIVHSVTDTLHLQGIMDGDGQLDEELWRVWEVNGMDAKHSPVWGRAGASSRSYVTAVPGVDELTGDPIAKVGVSSATRTLPVYAEPAHVDT